MSKNVILALCIAMVGFGIWLTLEWLAFGSRGVVFKLGGLLILIGVYLFWANFVGPDRERA